MRIATALLLLRNLIASKISGDIGSTLVAHGHQEKCWECRDAI